MTYIIYTIMLMDDTDDIQMRTCGCQVFTSTVLALYIQQPYLYCSIESDKDGSCDKPAPSKNILPSSYVPR